jgi:hypothetical protein
MPNIQHIVCPKCGYDGSEEPSALWAGPFAGSGKPARKGREDRFPSLAWRPRRERRQNRAPPDAKPPWP